MSESPKQVLLYMRPDCPLCDEALEGLLTLRREGHEFELHEIDIESDDTLHRKLVERIPVIEVNGAVATELFFDPGPVIARLATVGA